MSGSSTKGGLKARGRAFVNKQTLKKPATAPVPVAPVRPTMAAPWMVPVAAAKATEIELHPNIPPQPPVAKRPVEPDQQGNDSPEEGLPPQMVPHGVADESPDVDDVMAPAPPAKTAPVPSAAGAPKRPDTPAPPTTDAEETRTGVPEPYMVAKPVGKEYEGEFNQVGWRGLTPEDQIKTSIVTRAYNKHEQSDNELKVGPNGKFTKGSYTTAQGKVGFAMDAQGRTVAFKETDNTQVGSQQQNIHHSSVLGVDEVIGDDGKPMLAATGKPIMKARLAAAAGFISSRSPQLRPHAADRLRSGHGSIHLSFSADDH